MSVKDQLTEILTELRTIRQSIETQHQRLEDRETTLRRHLKSEHAVVFGIGSTPGTETR